MSQRKSDLSGWRSKTAAHSCKMLTNEMLKRFEEHGMDNVDVQALGVAYTQGLMREKQGSAIELPKHLHKRFI